jgi:hypothetical protein
MATYPIDLSTTIGTASQTVVPGRTSDQSIFFHNPSASATIAISTGLRAAAINGAGSYMLEPGQYIQFDIIAPGINTSVSWNAVASAGNTPLTIFVFLLSDP